MVAKAVLAKCWRYYGMQYSPFDVGRDARVALAVWGIAGGFLIGPKRAKEYMVKLLAGPLIARLAPSRSGSDYLDRHGNRLASSDAEGVYPDAAVALPQGVYQRYQGASAARADGMP